MVFAYRIVLLGGPFWWVHTTEGTIGGVFIGDGKEQALARPGKRGFSPQPKPTECPKNWIEPWQMTATEKGCLLNADLWRLGAIAPELCPSWSNASALLEFKDGKLWRVTTECRLAK
jgi:hypothetical protein